MKIVYIVSLSILVSIPLVSFQQKMDRKTKKALNHGFAYVPSGNLSFNGDSTSINAFIMFKGEVTNFQYRDFLSSLERNGEMEKLKIAQIDSTQWSSNKNNLNELTMYYHSHPAYNNYPVVNISKEAAQLYCEWLTANFLPNKNGDTDLKFRLPTHQEWVYAAKGGLKVGEYSWGGPYLTNTKGDQLANYVRFGAENISRDADGNLIVVKSKMSTICTNCKDVLAPSTSYWPNQYGLFNMNGNAAEMVADENIVAGGSWKDPGYDVRNESVKPYTTAAPNVGFRVVATAKSEDVTWIKK